MLPIYDDYELDLSRLTRITLNSYSIFALVSLPALVLGKELLCKGPWRQRINVVVTVLSMAIGATAIWAVVSQLFFYDDSLYL